MENVEFIWNSRVKEIAGEHAVNKVVIEHIDTKEEQNLEVSGIFIAVGIIPNTENFKGVADMDNQGYFIAGEDTKTSTKGIFVAGDVRTKQLRQIVTAVSDGANAITSIEHYLTEEAVK